MIKVRLYLSLSKHQAMKTRGGIGRIINLGANGGEWSASRPGRFTPGNERKYSLDRKVGGPQSRSGRGGDNKSSQPPLEIEP